MAANTTRQFARTALRSSTRTAFAAAPRQAFRQGHRFYSSEAPKAAGPNWALLSGLAVAGAGGAYFFTREGGVSAGSVPKVVNPTKKDYQDVYNEIASRLEEKDDYDDGSYGPVLVRLAWHASGTYDKETGTGGSNGATMRFAPEGDHGANAGPEGGARLPRAPASPGPWTFSPTVLTNDYFRLLLEEKWQWKKWDGPKQLEDKSTKTLMMLPTDYALIEDKAFLKTVKAYAKDNELFFKDFSNVIVRLFELGVPFKEGTESWVMKPTWDESP
ncbi:cytochrome c peroxidase [Verticillium alfalfae VaMs.102]|uniref:Cytochrome c peroxidase n=1 Tax=Verticillium alfalfae (strain VaMs.102 / ATCC MYA-4576 / FGSC 10136) TaxID=526221 RepID=C9SM32_VERA1|nr:cytochrome c peroxidase [Verticillium alfalfae VaMs.102]EEY19847.1 cytochrome c peroxidase [Verticillium alfalfae VaMs.102]